MRFNTKYKLLLIKGYFDKGFSVTNYLKYFIAFFALASLDVWLTLLIAFIYGIFCFVFGWWWYHYGWVKAENEVNNRYNLFVEEMRKSIKRKI